MNEEVDARERMAEKHRQLVKEASKMKTRRSDSGTAMVELALLLPLLMLICMGTIDLARLFYAAVTVVGGARAGVQYGGQGNTYTGDFTGIQQHASENAQDLGGGSVPARRDTVNARMTQPLIV